MADTQSGPGWSDAQWELVGKTVTEAFDSASVAGKFLPCYGPLTERDDYVRAEKVTTTGSEVSVTDDKTLKLFTLAVKVPLSREQVRDENLSSALLAFRRAAILLAQVEDYLVFKGFDRDQNELVKERVRTRPAGDRPTKAELREEMASFVVTSAPSELRGLTLDAVEFELKPLSEAAPQEDFERRGESGGPLERDTEQQRRGEALIKAVSTAIGVLEDRAHPGPFACILGSDLFDDAHTPRTRSMVLPADRIKPLLRGPLLRSGQMDDATGILVPHLGNDIDLVVATPPRVQFLQVREDAKHLFRVYEKFTMRIKDIDAVVSLEPPLPQVNGPVKPRATKGNRPPNGSEEKGRT